MSDNVFLYCLWWWLCQSVQLGMESGDCRWHWYKNDTPVSTQTVKLYHCLCYWPLCSLCAKTSICFSSWCVVFEGNYCFCCCSYCCCCYCCFCFINVVAIAVAVAVAAAVAVAPAAAAAVAVVVVVVIVAAAAAVVVVVIIVVVDVVVVVVLLIFLLLLLSLMMLRLLLLSYCFVDKSLTKSFHFPTANLPMKTSFNWILESSKVCLSWNHCKLLV